jgi:hypothetical protein
MSESAWPRFPSTHFQGAWSSLPGRCATYSSGSRNIGLSPFASSRLIARRSAARSLPCSAPNTVRKMICSVISRVWGCSAKLSPAGQLAITWRVISAMVAP